MSKIYSQDFQSPCPAINAAMTGSPGSFQSLSIDKASADWISGLSEQLGAAGRQRDRLSPVRIRYERQVAGVAQADRSTCDASGCPSRYRHAALGIPQFAAIQTAAPSFGVDLTPIGVRDAIEIEPLTATHRDSIIMEKHLASSDKFTGRS